MNDRTYSYSTDGESYAGNFPTVLDALHEAFASSNRQRIYVGRSVPPVQPEMYWEADHWLEHVSCQDDYGGDWAEDWDESTPQQKQELETEVQKVMAAWLDRHGLRPSFWTIEDDKQYTRKDYDAMLAVRTPKGATHVED